MQPPQPEHRRLPYQGTNPIGVGPLTALSSIRHYRNSMNGRTVLYFDAKTHCAMLLRSSYLYVYGVHCHAHDPAISRVRRKSLSCGRAISRPSGVSTFREFRPVSSIVVQRITDLP